MPTGYFHSKIKPAQYGKQTRGATKNIRLKSKHLKQQTRKKKKEVLLTERYFTKKQLQDQALFGYLAYQQILRETYLRPAIDNPNDLNDVWEEKKLAQLLYKLKDKTTSPDAIEPILEKELQPIREIQKRGCSFRIPFSNILFFFLFIIFPLTNTSFLEFSVPPERLSFFNHVSTYASYASYSFAASAYGSTYVNSSYKPTLVSLGFVSSCVSSAATVAGTAQRFKNAYTGKYPLSAEDIQYHGLYGLSSALSLGSIPNTSLSKPLKISASLTMIPSVLKNVSPFVHSSSYIPRYIKEKFPTPRKSQLPKIVEEEKEN